jgi:hypothetical protein
MGVSALGVELVVVARSTFLSRQPTLSIQCALISVTAYDYMFVFICLEDSAPGDPKFGRILDFSESSHKIGNMNELQTNPTPTASSLSPSSPVHPRSVGITARPRYRGAVLEHTRCLVK